MITALLLSLSLGAASFEPPPKADPPKADPPAECTPVCEKVADKTLGRWPKKRKGTKEQKEEFQKAREAIIEQCKKDCATRGKRFIRCIKRARTRKHVSKCYQRAR